MVSSLTQKDKMIDDKIIFHPWPAPALPQARAGAGILSFIILSFKNLCFFSHIEFVNHCTTTNFRMEVTAWVVPVPLSVKRK